MCFPVVPHIFDCPCERLVRISKEYRSLILAAIRMDGVPVAKAVRRVIPHNRLPLPGVVDLELHGVLHNPLAPPPIRTANANLIRDEIDHPGSCGEIGIRHADVPDERCQHLIVPHGLPPRNPRLGALAISTLPPRAAPTLTSQSTHGIKLDED